MVPKDERFFHTIIDTSLPDNMLLFFPLKGKSCGIDIGFARLQTMAIGEVDEAKFSRASVVQHSTIKDCPCFDGLHCHRDSALFRFSSLLIFLLLCKVPYIGLPMQTYRPWSHRYQDCYCSFFSSNVALSVPPHPCSYITAFSLSFGSSFFFYFNGCPEKFEDVCESRSLSSKSFFDVSVPVHS